MDPQAVHLPYGLVLTSRLPGSIGEVSSRHFRHIGAAAQLASGASRAACYGHKGAAGPGRIDPTPPFGPIHLPYSRSA